MSGIYIPDMEMPTSCRYCEFRHISITQDAFCTASHETIDYKADRTKRLPSCPLVPVPPHGRLIDADEFEKENAYYWHCDFINPKYDDTLADLVNAAPTIIPADEEGDKDA